MHRLSVLTVLGLVVLFAAMGCVKSRVLVVVKPDGSGHLVLTQLSSGQYGSYSSRSRDDLTAELEELATRLGDGVTLARSEPVGVKGFAAVFAFTNVSSVAVPLMALGPLDESYDVMDDAPPLLRQSIGFSFARDGNSRLSIAMPAGLAEAMARPVETNADATAASRPSGAEAVAGVDVDVSVQVMGQIIACSASHTNAARKDRFTLLHFDGGRFADNPAAMRLLGEEPGGEDEVEEYMARVLRVGGATVETNRAVTIVFR